MNARPSLKEFTAEVMWNFGIGDLALDVVDLEGKHPVIPALDHEPLAVLIQRVMMVSRGYANVFVHSSDKIRQVSFIPASDAILADEADDMSEEPPSGLVTVGAFLDYLETQPAGVNIPALLPIPTAARASNVRPVTLEPVEA